MANITDSGVWVHVLFMPLTSSMIFAKILQRPLKTEVFTYIKRSAWHMAV